MGAPVIGTIENGYRFKGGDPADEGAWEQAASLKKGDIDGGYVFSGGDPGDEKNWSMYAEPKKPGLVDTLNQAGFFPASPRTAPADPKAAAQPYENWQRDPKAISAPGSVMDGFVPQDRSGDRTAENDVGPMRADAVDKIKQQLRNNPTAAKALSTADSRLAPLAGRVLDQQQNRRDRGGLPATRDDVLSDVEQGKLPYDPQMQAERSWGDAAKDSGKQLVEGAVGIADSVTNLVAPDSAFAAQTGALRQDWYDAQSPEIKAKLQEIDAKVKEAGKEGVWEEIKAAASEYSDPAVAARLAMTNIASIIPGLAVGKVAKAATLAKGATALQAGAAATTAAGATNAVLNGGSARGEAFDALNKAYLAQGLSESEATKKALSESWVAGGVGAATGFVSGKFGGAEKALLNGASGALGRKAAATAAGKAFVTEQLGEQVEELAPQLASNVQLNGIDGRSITQGLGSTAVQTAIGAGPMSALGGVSEYSNARRPEQSQPTPQPQSAPDNIASVTANAAELDATAGRDIDTLDQNLEARDATQARTGATPDSALPLINTPTPEVTVQQLVGTEATPIQTLWAEAMIKNGKGIALDGYETYLMKYPPADVDVATAEQRVKQDVIPNNGIAAPVNMALPVTAQQQMLADEEANLTPSRANSEALFSEDPTFDNINETTAPGEPNVTPTVETQQAETQRPQPSSTATVTNAPTQKVTAPRPTPVAASPHAETIAKALPDAQDIQVHSSDSLGSEVSSVSSGQMGKYRAKIIERIAKAFGRKSVVFFSSANETADGMMISGTNDPLYININSGIDPLAVVGHEWRHSIKQTNQAAHAAIQTAAKAILAKDGKLLEYANQYHGNEMQKAGVAERLARIEAGTATEQDMDFLAEEFSSDIAGNMWRDPEALRQVFDTILEENPPSVARSIIKSIADAITSLINRLLLSTPKSGFNELGISREELLSLKKEIQAAMVSSFKEDIKRRDNKISAARTAPSSEPSATGAPTYGKRDAMGTAGRSGEADQVQNLQSGRPVNNAGSDRVKLSPSRHTQPAYDALGDFWLNVAQHKDLFYYPTTDAKTIEKAFEDVVVKNNPSFSIEPVSTTNIEEVGKAPSESGDKVWAIWDGTNLLGKIHERGNEVWISVAGMVSGSGGGASVYSAVGQYAHNTGKEFIGDPAGFEGTPGARLGEIRRVEHLISQALRYGSTDHVTLGDDHVANKGWKKGNFRENLDLLLKESYANYEWLFEASPKLAQVKFDVQSEQFTINGRPVSDFHFKALLGHQTRGISGVSGNVGRGTTGVVRGARIGEAIGVSTAKRAIVAKTILEGMDSSAAGRILAGIDTKLDAKGLAAESGIRRVQYSNPRFVSKLATQIDNVPSRLEVQPATQWRLWLSSNAAKLGIKKDEIEWSGINDYLAMRGKEKVSKADIAAYLSKNGTQVKEVVLGKSPKIGTVTQALDYLAESKGMSTAEIMDEYGYSSADDYITLANELRSENGVAGGETKFSQYVVPGGTNYRELLITLPEQRPLTKAWRDAQEKYGDEDQRTVDAKRLAKAEAKGGNTFKSSHFDTPNILAHLRFDERPDAEGNKVLFIQELQSDWGQTGKKEGFGTQASYSIKDQNGNIRGHFDTEAEAQAYLLNPPSFVDQKNSKIVRSDIPGIPTAPFVQDTKNWVALGLKRAIMYAVQHGMTRVAWANGEQNADHYDLSKQITSIEYEDQGDGTYHVIAIDKQGNSHLGDKYTAAQLEDTVGKEVAQKITNGEGPMVKGSGVGRQYHELSGLDLKVGSGGMRVFYDQIVPSVASDVLRKLGGGKVEAVSIAKDFGGINPKTGKPRGANFSDENRLMQQQGFTITDSMKAKVSEGVPLFSPSRSALTGQPIRGANFTLPSETKAQESQRLIQDATNRWEIVQAAVLEQGGTIDDDTNVARAIQLYPGRVGASFEDLNHRLVEPLLERMAKTGATMDQIGTYLYALHAPERNAEMAKKNPRFPDGGSGMTNADAAQLVANFRALPNFVEIDAVAKGFQALTKRRLAFMVRAGVMSQDQMDAYQAAYKAYVPLKGFEDMDENGKPTGSGKGFSTGNKIDKRALGRESRAGQIIENIVRDFEAGLILAEKANVGRVVKAFVEANPDAKLWEVDNPPKEQQMSTAGNVFLKTAQYNPEAEIQFLENGKPVRVQIYDKILLRAYNNIGAKELDAVSKTFNVYNSWLRQMYTQKNPAWFVLNLLKDQQSAAMYMTGEKGAGFALKNLTKMPKAMSLAWAMYHNKPMSAANQALVNDFRRSGGMTGFAYVGDIEAKANQLQGALAKYQTWGETKSQGMKALMTKAINNKFFDYIEALNTTFENTTRLATFMTAIESGASSKEAAQLAKNVTVNFNVHGEYGPSINAWYLFANAGIQGTRNIGHALFYSPHKAQVWALASGAVMLGVLAGMMGDDDDDLIDDSTRSRALVIKVGDSKVLIPTAYGWGFFTSMGQLIAQAMKHPDKREKIALKMASSAFDHFGFFGNPVAGDELSLKSAVANTTPTAVRPFVQSATNTSSFGGPLYPESQFNPTQPDSEKAWRKTKGSAYDQFAKWMNSVSGGDAAQEGAVSVSPESLKQMTSTLGGGALRLVTDMLSLPVEAANNGGVKAKNVPVLKSFYQAIDVDDYRRQFGEAAANAEETLRVANNYKKAARKPGADQSVKEAKKDYDKENQHLIAAGRMVTSYRERIASLRDEEDKLRAEKGPSEVQRLKLAQNTARQIAAVKQFNVSVKKANNNSLMPDRQ